MIKMQRKVDAHEYHSLKQFDRDVQLMVRNCEKYRGKADEYTKVGVISLRMSCTAILI